MAEVQEFSIMLWVPNSHPYEHKIEDFASVFFKLVQITGEIVPMASYPPQPSSILPLPICEHIFDYFTLNEVSAGCMVNSTWLLLLKPRIPAAIQCSILSYCKILRHWQNGKN